MHKHFIFRNHQFHVSNTVHGSHLIAYFAAQLECIHYTCIQIVQVQALVANHIGQINALSMARYSFFLVNRNKAITKITR